MIPWLRILLYFSLFTFLIVRLKKKDQALTNAETVFAFALKILLGCLYGYVHLHFYNGDDTWQYNQESLIEAAKLKSQPLLFFTDLIPHSVDSLQTLKDFINMSLEHDLLIKLLGLFSFFSGGNYYVNVIFFNFFLFWGHYWLFRFLLKKYPHKRLSLLVSIFFIPTFVFWLSGIRGDGLVLLFLVLFFVQFQHWMDHRTGRHFVYALLAMVGIFIFRSAILLVLLPFAFGWYVAQRFRKPPLITYLATYCICIIIFFGSGLLHPSLNLPAIIVDKQAAFMALPGKTRFDMKPLEPRWQSFMNAIPSALENTFLRPYPWESIGMLQLVTSLETAVYLLVIVALVPFFDWKKAGQEPWLVGALFFSFSIFVFIGLTIPFPGAIIRYKVIPELLLLTCLLVGSRHIKNFRIR